MPFYWVMKNQRLKYSTAKNLSVPKVVIQNPFAVPRLPAILRLYRQGYRLHGNRLGRAAMRVAFRSLYRLTRNHGKKRRAGMVFRGTKGTRLLQFSISNLQYHSVFFPQHRPVYEPEVAAVMTLLAPNVACFWDVGANWGHHSLFMLSLPTFKGSVESFEPDKEIAAELNGHFKTIGAVERARCHPFGLLSRRGKAPLQMPDGLHSGLAFVDLNSDFEAGSADFEQGDKVSFSPPNLMKIDAEGCEREVLLGCVGLLSKHRPVLILELWPAQIEQTAAIVRLLQEHAYQLFFPVFTSTGEGETPGHGGAVHPHAVGELSLRDLSASSGLERINALALPAEHFLIPAMTE